MKCFCKLPALAAGLCAILLTGCFKPADGVDSGKKNNVTLTFSTYGQEDFTRSGEELRDHATRLSVALFRADGTKVKAVNQTSADTGFGQLSLSLQTGTYRVVAVAHSSTEGNATISSPEKVTFASNKMTDTFSACEVIEVSDENLTDADIQLQRVVAMLRLTVAGNIPQDVSRWKFYYTGGSSTLNPTTGYGCVQSKQTEYRQAHDDAGEAVRVYELYTAPHELNDVLKMVVTAQGPDGSAMNEWTMDNIPVTRNKITTWEGSLFQDSGEGGEIGSGTISIGLDSEWDGTISYTW